MNMFTSLLGLVIVSHLSSKGSRRFSSPPLSFLVIQPRVSHFTLVVAHVSQVKLHVPIKDNDDLDMNINKITNNWNMDIMKY